MGTTKHRRMVLLVTALLLAGGCGGDDPTADPADEAPPSSAASDGAGTDASASTTGADDEQAPVADDDGCPIGECDDGLLPSLSGVPMPPTVQAFAYGTPAAERTDGSATQQVLLTGSVGDVAAYYDESLEAAGFEVTFRYADGDEYAVDFVDPEGRVGGVSAYERAWHPLVMDVILEVE